MSASTGDSVTFAAPSSYASDNNSSNFMWDFGDGTTTTTSEATTTHTFSEPGNFTVTLRVQGDVGERIIQTYGITVNPKANDLFEILKIVIPLLAASITAGVSLYIYRKNKKTQNKENLNPTLPPPAPPKQCRQ
jgi:PKD repeat protein